MRLVRFTFNWIAIALIPLWTPLFAWICLWLDRNGTPTKNVLTGKEWIMKL